MDGRRRPVRLRTRDSVRPPRGARSHHVLAVAPRPSMLRPPTAQHRTTAAYHTMPMMMESLRHFFDSPAAACAPATSPCESSVFTLDALMMAGIASGQNRKIETIDIVML